MRMFLISLAAAASAMAVATPASAQYRPVQRAPQGYAYGYNNYGQVRALQARVDQIQRNLAHLARNRMITRGEYSNRYQDALQIERLLRRDARDGRGLTRSELYTAQQRITRLEYRINRDIRDGRQWRYRW